MRIRALASAFAMAAAFAAAPSFAASQISPSQPSEFDPVNLRMTVDSCAFVPGSVAVSAVGNVIRVAYSQNFCLVAGEARIVDVLLGTFPVSNWSVEVYPGGVPIGLPNERIAFTVQGRPQIAVFPPPPRPLTDYSGMWFRAAESGWGLSIHQSPSHVVFGAWYVYDAAGNPTWYTLQSGEWASSTQWTGKVYRSSGPPFFAPVFDPTRVVTSETGIATLDFTQKPGEEGIATLSYVVNGQAGIKRITRLQF